jgi:Zn ribbon nucleic-acid-binding protein
LPIYVYTYELSEGEQIYAAINRCLRLHDHEAIAFWRPLIWKIDRALAVLPPYKGKLFRGINVRFSEEAYRTGRDVCWEGFSSASADKAVAEQFVKGDEGSLFILQSASARAISRFSKFPDEAEVLFRPNTVFSVISTLYGQSDIGQFYSCIDSIAMRESSATVGALRPSGSCPRDSHVVVAVVPPQLWRPTIDHIRAMDGAVVTSVDFEHDETGLSTAQVRLAADPSVPVKCAVTPACSDSDPADVCWATEGVPVVWSVNRGYSDPQHMGQWVCPSSSSPESEDCGRSAVQIRVLPSPLLIPERRSSKTLHQANPECSKNYQ